MSYCCFVNASIHTRPWYCSALRQDLLTIGAESVVHGVSLYSFFQVRVSLRSPQNKKFHFQSSTAQSPAEATLGHPGKAASVSPFCRCHSAHVSSLLDSALSSHSTAARQDQSEGRGSLREAADEDDMGHGAGRPGRKSRLRRAGRGGFGTRRCGDHLSSISQHSYIGVLELQTPGNAKCENFHRHVRTGV